MMKRVMMIAPNISAVRAAEIDNLDEGDEVTSILKKITENKRYKFEKII